MPSKPVLEVSELRIQRGDTVILDRINWRALPGEHWVILGANGSGKTSLLSALTGYLTPTAGNLSVLGRRYGRSDWRELRKHIGLVSSSVRQMMADHEPALFERKRRRVLFRQGEEGIGRHPSRRQGYELVDQRGNDVEGRTDRGMTRQVRRHVRVVLERVKARPRHRRRQGQRVGVVGLMEVPDQRQADRSVHPPYDRTRRSALSYSAT